MRVLIVPSWFPSKEDPVAGIFVADQVKALARVPGVSVTILSWGHGDSHVPLHKPFAALLVILRHFCRKLNRRELTKLDSQVDLNVLAAPALTVSSRVSRNWYSAILGAADRAMDRYVKSGQSFDIIHAHCAIPAGLVAMALSEKYLVPYVITEHAFPSRTPAMLSSHEQAAKFGSVFRDASRAFAVSKSLANEISSLGVANVDVLPNVYDDSVFVSQGAPRYSGGVLKLLSVANATNVKGLDVLLRAIADYRYRLGEDVKCIIAGGGPGQKELKKLSKVLGVRDAVKFEGALSRSELLKRYRDCSAVVISSHRETFGMVGVEALACGRLIVSTRCGGPEEYIVDKKNGLLVNVNSPRELSQAFMELRALLSTYSSQEISKDIFAKYSSSNFARALLEAYDDVIMSEQ